MAAKTMVKVVVRLLPPEITEEELLQTIPEAHREQFRWRSFQQGKRYRGEAKPSLNTRCSFAFETQQRADDFIKEYHGHQFVDGQGENFRAVACFAPYQKIPRMKPTKDPRDGTIKDDATFKEFVEGLSKASGPYEAPPNPVTLLKPLDYGDTPLLNFMKQRAKERRARLEKQRRRWQPQGLDAVEEEPKRARWHCAECFTTKHLEEDPDDRGTFYCTYCWEFWESQAYSQTKVKKKKKAKDEAEQEDTATAETGKKKKKKKHEQEQEGRESSHSHWHSKEWSSGYYEEEETDAKKKKKKKKDKQYEAEEEETHAAKSKWRPKADESYGYDYDRGYSSKSTGYSSKSRGDEWWESKPEKTEEKPSKKKGDKYEKGRGTAVWAPKQES